MAKDYQYLFSQLRRIEEHREKKAEKEIRKIYKEILKDTKQFIAEEYYQLAEDGKLTYEILRSKGQDVRFLAEIEQRLGDVSLSVSDEIKQAVNELYQIAYDGVKDAVQNGKDTASFFEGVDATTVQTMRSAVDNPIMEIALEKNHKDITWGIKREVATALTVGDRFETLAHRIADNLDRSYRKGILIARTEMHRVREAGHHESAKDLDETLKQGSSGMRMVKVWKTMKDGVVRPQSRYKTKKGWKTGKIRPGAPDHVKMHGKVVLADEMFDLGGGVETIAPGQSGVAGHDCNCRCTVLYKLMDDEQFFKATGRHFDEKAVAKKENRDKIEAGAMSGAYNDINDPQGKKRDAHAKRYYASLRNSDRESVVDSISENTGIERVKVAKMYDHLIVNKYDLDDGYKHFVPDYYMAESWRRLREGKEIQAHDLIMIQHEAMEYDLMNRDGLPYLVAHDATNQVYNYRAALDKWLDENEGR